MSRLAIATVVECSHCRPIAPSIGEYRPGPTTFPTGPILAVETLNYKPSVPKIACGFRAG